MGTLRSAIKIAVTVFLLGIGQTALAASFVKVAGTRTRTSTLNSSMTAPVPSSGVAAGDSVIVALQVGTLGGAVTCSDSINGSYDTDVISTPGVAGIAILSKHNVAALGFGDSITCSYPTFNGASSMTAYEFAGLETVSPLDQTAQSLSASAGAASSGLTASTSQARELVFGFFWLPSVTQTFVPATSGGNPLENPYDPAWAQPFASGTQKTMYRFVGSIRQFEANGTVVGVGGWLAQVATYRLAPDICENVSCDDNNPCTTDSCDPATGQCAHVAVSAGTSCGDHSSGVCDAADFCDGFGVCQPNHVADGTICGGVDGDCEIEDTCLAGVCHDNGVKPAGTACGDPGSSQCDAADTCNASGFCLANLAPDGSACGDAGSECVNADACLSGACHDNGFKAVGTACGDGSSGACDQADSCDGSGSCRVNHLADGTACGDAGTECINQDTCASGACHDNGFKAAGIACGDGSSGACDNADSCDGSGACQSNHVADGSPCGDAGTECTNADVCASGACHDNGYKAAGTACGNPASGQCDGADSCDGAGGCNARNAAAGTPCNDGDACTKADACNGSGSCSGVGDPICSTCIDNTAPVVSPTVVASPADPLALGTGTVTVAASFTDSPDQTRTCTIDWGDGSAPDAGAVVEPTATDPGTCTGIHLYTAVGVYTVSVSVADPCGESAGAIYQYAVLYDPSAGFVTGGGWILSPPGAFTPNPALTGKAFFGFVSGYFKGNTTVPSGRTEFHFHAADFNFSSTSYEWLVISGAKARFRGTGQVNGTGQYGFALTAWDGQAPGGGGIDRFRIRIWDETDGDRVIYDNQVACPNQGDNADPCTAIGGGAIVLHKK
jgi:Dictyostelium (slime mold) repeat